MIGGRTETEADEGLLVFGVILTLVLAFKTRLKTREKLAEQDKERIYAPYVVIALGSLLAAVLYSLLHASFESSVRQRFDLAALNHTEEIEHGIETYLKVLYQIRSGIEASVFIDREEFRIFVSGKAGLGPNLTRRNLPKVKMRGQP